MLTAQEALVQARAIVSAIERALDQTINSVKSKTSLALSRSMAYHPEVQHAVVAWMETRAPGTNGVAVVVYPAATTLAWTESSVASEG